MVELLYALDIKGRMVHVNDVPNGISCRCVCPACFAPLIAKNNGETMTPHFAHASGAICHGAHESELHILAKEIICEAKAVVLPSYGNVYDGGLVHFDAVEVEKRNDLATLQPDLCGVVYNKGTGTDRRLWIEIRVTHAIGPDKRNLIRRNKIACMEINLSSYMNRQVSRQELKSFILTEKIQREWTNNPILESRRIHTSTSSRDYAMKKVEESKKKLQESMSAYELGQYYEDEQNSFLAKHVECCIIESKQCFKCKHHTTRTALFEEAKRLHLPVWVKAALSSNLLYWTHDNVKQTVEFDKCYTVHFDNYLHLLPTSTPDVHGRHITHREIRQNEIIISFFLNVVPSIIASEGLKCHHNVMSFPTASYKYNIACNMSNVVNKHRRNKGR